MKLENLLNSIENKILIIVLIKICNEYPQIKFQLFEFFSELKKNNIFAKTNLRN